jgi:hypothetical protein
LDIAVRIYIAVVPNGTMYIDHLGTPTLDVIANGQVTTRDVDGIDHVTGLATYQNLLTSSAETKFSIGTIQILNTDE